MYFILKYATCKAFWSISLDKKCTTKFRELQNPKDSNIPICVLFREMNIRSVCVEIKILKQL